MDSRTLTSFMLAAGLAVIAGGAGCASKPQYLPPPDKLKSMDEKRAKKAAKKSAKEPGMPTTIHALVAYGTDGKPVYVELRESTGDALVDQRAVDMILKTKQFPPGKADTVLIPVDVKSIPKE